MLPRGVTARTPLVRKPALLHDIQLGVRAVWSLHEAGGGGELEGGEVLAGEEADEIGRREDGLAVDQLYGNGPSLSIRRATIRLVGGESWRMSAILRLRRAGA